MLMRMLLFTTRSLGKPSIKRIEGRTDDFLVATNGRVISPTVFFPYPFDNLDEIKQFRVVQERKDKLRIGTASLKRLKKRLNSFSEKT